MGSSPQEECILFWRCGRRLVYCCASRLLSKSISTGSCVVVGGFSLIVICGLLSSGDRVQISYCGKGLQDSCSVLRALELWWGTLFTCGGGLLSICLQKQVLILLL